MSSSVSVYEQLQAQSAEPGEVLAQLVTHFRESRMPHELFEALKLQTRQRLGLPLFSGQSDPVAGEELDRQMEMGLIDACREVGQMLMREGRIAEGWMYLRPVGNLPLVAEMMKDIPANDENVDDLVQVLLHEGVDIVRGLKLVLQYHGTCNSITTYEQSIAGLSHPQQQPAAAVLLDHIYDELRESICADIEQREGQQPEQRSIDELIANRGWLFSDSAYHIDTTHLASTLRFARVLVDKTHLRRAWELTQYGRKLNRQFHYPGDEPFADFYNSHELFFSVLLGQRVEQGLAYFERKLRNVDMSQAGTGPIETYVNLLDRLGRPDEALQVAIQYMPQDVPTQRVVPMLAELAEKSGNFEQLAQFCQQRDDLLSYAAVLIRQNAGK